MRIHVGEAKVDWDSEPSDSNMQQPIIVAKLVLQQMYPILGSELEDVTSFSLMINYARPTKKGSPIYKTKKNNGYRKFKVKF